MMKKILFVLFGLLYGAFSFLFAEDVPVDKALQVATRFAQQIEDKPLRSGQSLELAYAARPSLRAAAPQAYYYVFNRGSSNGYIIVAGDDRAYPILGYATTGDFSNEKIPDNMKWWLQEYADQIQYAYTNITEPEADVKKRWEVLQTGNELPSLKSEVLLNTASWGQHSPFNNQCPMVNGQQAITGSVATAMAIIMKYHKYPDQGTGLHSYTDDNGNTYSADFSQTYDWDQMPDDYPGNYTPAEGNAVATLMYHCGVSCEMNYAADESRTSLEKIAIALPQYFKYDPGIYWMTRDGYSENEWESLIQNELDNNRPIPYGGTTSGNAGHAFVLAGYNNSDQYYVNWGGGKMSDGSDYNGWFRLSALTLNGNSYNYQQDMVIGIDLTEDIPSTSYKVTWNTLSGVTISPVSGFNANSIAAGGTFKFTITNTTGKAVVVKNGTVILTPDAAGVYTISNIQKNIQLNLSLISLTYKVTWNPLSGVTVSPLSGYNANSIAAGGIFKFEITNTTGKKVIVKNGTVTLEPDASGVYTIPNIQGNTVLTLSFETVMIYQVTLPTVSGFDIQAAPGYNASSVESGSDFKFTITPYAVYENYTIRVRANGIPLSSADGTTYIIKEVNTDQIVEVKVEIEESPPIVTNYYRIISYVDTGAALIPENGYNADAVEEGNDFKFYVDLDYEYRNWEVTVKVDGVVLSSDSWGVYEISNVYSDRTVIITLSEVFTVTYVNPWEEIEVVTENGYNMDRVVAGNDFVFHLVSPYNEGELAVYANGNHLVPWLSLYTIRNVQEDQKITVQMIGVGNEKIPSDEVRIEMGENKICITHPYMENIPVYVTSLSGVLYTVDKLNGVYTELELSGKGIYMIYFEGFSRKIIVR